MFVNDLLKEIKFAEIFDRYVSVDKNVVIECMNPIVRLKCLHCGLMNRKPGCVFCTPSLMEAKNEIEEMESGYVFVWKSDGTKSWKENKEELSHITFKKRKGRQLKGTEMGMARYIQYKMLELNRLFKMNGYLTLPFISGHCDVICGAKKCPKRTPNRCTEVCRAVFPSLEAWYMDVFKLCDELNIERQYPAIDYIQLISMILLKRRA